MHHVTPFSPTITTRATSRQQTHSHSNRVSAPKLRDSFGSFFVPTSTSFTIAAAAASVAFGCFGFCARFFLSNRKLYNGIRCFGCGCNKSTTISWWSNCYSRIYFAICRAQANRWTSTWLSFPPLFSQSVLFIVLLGIHGCSASVRVIFGLFHFREEIGEDERKEFS